MVYQRHIELWHIEVSELIDACEKATEEDQFQILMKLKSLVELAPEEKSHFFLPRVTDRSIDQKMASAAYVDAAISLLGRRSGYMLSRGPDGPALASVWTPDGQQEFHASGQTEAIAIVAANAMLVLASAGIELG